MESLWPSPTVFVLPSTIFAGWKTKTITNPASEIVKSYNFLDSQHIAFPYYWESQECWLLAVLASFSDLLGHEDASKVDAADLNFGFILLDAQNSNTKAQYSQLLRPLRDFTTALLTPRLDVHHAAIASVKLTVPLVPPLDPTDHQPLQPGHFLSQILTSPDSFIAACRDSRFDDEMWDLPGRKDVLPQFQSFLAIHSSIVQANRKWKEIHPAHGPACVVRARDDDAANIQS
ncbi:hypothetical protein FRC04_009994 [Tulasnella sp. 424]|nr:hypothetical protein FRC04_009994 [Tulasnella sp. 424]